MDETHPRCVRRWEQHQICWHPLILLQHDKVVDAELQAQALVGQGEHIMSATRQRGGGLEDEVFGGVGFKVPLVVLSVIVRLFPHCHSEHEH